MQSTANYLWHTDDLLGQGATASVYKARNKVGHSPGQAPSGWARSGPCQPLVGSKGGVWRGRGLAHSGAGGRYGFGKKGGELWRAPWDGASVRNSLGLERERERKRKTQSRHPGQAAANVGIAESGSGACLDFPAFVAALYRPGALYGLCETYCTVLSQELGPEQVLVPALLQAPGSGLPVWSWIEMVIAATNHPLHLCHQGQRALIPSQCWTGPSSL